jgi:hypothetical protein
MGGRCRGKGLSCSIEIAAGLQHLLALRSLASSRIALPLGHCPAAPNWQIPCRAATRQDRLLPQGRQPLEREKQHCATRRLEFGNS